MGKGFILMDIIIGLFLLGLIVIVSLPMICSGYTHYLHINTMTEMNYLGESIYERLCSKDRYSDELIQELIGKEEVEFQDLNPEDLEKYEVKIINLDQDGNLLDIKIIIKSNFGGNIQDVEFKGSILR